MELVIGDRDVEKIGVCPYDSNHKIKMKKIEAHMEKCRDRNRPRQFETCPYNETHVKFKEEIKLHMELCPDKLCFGKVTDIDSFVVRKSCVEREIENRDVLGNEDWDAEEVPQTYDPETKLKDVRFQPKNFHKRKEETYHPRVYTVIDSNYRSECGVNAPMLDDPYYQMNCSSRKRSSGYGGSAKNVEDWEQCDKEEEEEDSFDAEFAEEQKLASLKNVKMWLEKMQPHPNANSSFGESEIPPGFSLKRSSTPINYDECFQTLPLQNHNQGEKDPGASGAAFASHVRDLDYFQRFASNPHEDDETAFQPGAYQNYPYPQESENFEEEFARENNIHLFRS
ncbi:Hypothetical predicted protein [Cloeon dipterum]|uniref:CHHC U11-48K-type domain-containing protein n=2 Tax=Cloeon dipterum TaxID=197152 RepID=A0A8S1CSB5_9INSE|nr:Hypothetical predicted protein [Cloeon dipterum]